MKFENGDLKTSYRTAFLNILKLLLSLTMMIFGPSKYMAKYNFFRINISTLPNFSVFSLIVVLVGTICNQVSAFYLFGAQIVKRRKVMILLQEAFGMKLKDEYLVKFEKDCLKSSVIVCVYFVIYIFLKFFQIMNISFVNFLVFLTFIYPFIIVMSFASFTKNFENFVVACMEEIGDDVGELQKVQKGDERVLIQNYLKLSRKHQKIQNLLQTFHNAFERQLTKATCFIVATIVFTVSAYYYKS